MAYFLATNVLSDTPPSVIPYIFGNKNQYIKTPVIDSEVNKVETDIYITKAYMDGNAIMGSQWGGDRWLLAQDGNLAWMTSPRTTFASRPIAIGGHKLVMDLENGSTYDGVSVSSPGATIGYDNKNIALFASDDTGGNKADVGIGRTKFYRHGTMLMDLVPINEYNRNLVLADHLEYTTTGNQAYRTSETFIRDYLRFESSYLDTNGNIHYADHTMLVSDYVTRTSFDFTYDNNETTSVTLWGTATNAGVQVTGMPTDATKVIISVYNSNNAKEGGFYDIVNDKYYFSSTSTPLVYSEL